MIVLAWCSNAQQGKKSEKERKKKSCVSNFQTYVPLITHYVFEQRPRLLCRGFWLGLARYGEKPQIIGIWLVDRGEFLSQS